MTDDQRPQLPLRRPRGRPKKFGRAARAVTLTLPEDVLRVLAGVDEDLGRAVVRITSRLGVGAKMRLPSAELSRYRDSAVIVIRQERALERIDGVSLVPLPDGRALISLDGRMSVADFELNLRDALEDTRLPAQEHLALASIAEILRTARTARGVALEARNIIVLRSQRRRRRD